MKRVITFLALVASTPALLAFVLVVWLIATVGVLLGTHDFHLERERGTISPTIRRRAR